MRSRHSRLLAALLVASTIGLGGCNQAVIDGVNAGIADGARSAMNSLVTGFFEAFFSGFFGR